MSDDYLASAEYAGLAAELGDTEQAVLAEYEFAGQFRRAAFITLLAAAALAGWLARGRLA